MVALASVGAGEQRKKGENVFICWHLWWWQLALFAREEWMIVQQKSPRMKSVNRLRKKMSTQLTVLLQELQFKIS